jgi:hypothetical protein
VPDGRRAPERKRQERPVGDPLEDEPTEGDPPAGGPGIRDPRRLPGETDEIRLPNDSDEDEATPR